MEKPDREMTEEEKRLQREQEERRSRVERAAVQIATVAVQSGLGARDFEWACDAAKDHLVFAKREPISGEALGGNRPG